MTKHAEPRVGQPVLPYVGQASLWADLLRMLNSWKAGELGAKRKRTAVRWQPVGVNKLDDERRAGTLVRPGLLNHQAAVADPAAVMLQRSTPVYELADPVWHTAIDGVVVLPKHVQVDEVVPIRNSRMIIAIVNTPAGTPDNSRYAMVDPTAPHTLRASTGGIFEIIGDYDASGSNIFALVDTTSHQPLWRYEMTQPSNAPSDTNIKLLDLDGDVFAETAKLTDPDGLMDNQTTGDKGWCIHAGNKFYAIQAVCA